MAAVGEEAEAEAALAAVVEAPGGSELTQAEALASVAEVQAP